MASQRIPLFPLEVVLFPGAPLPLHIFEPRYKLMVARCLKSQCEFGIVLARSEGIASVGCSAEILNVAKKYPDGRMDILTIGQSPYRIRQVFEEQPYLEGDVEFLDDDAAPGNVHTQKRLLELFEQCHTLIYGQPSGLTEANSTSLRTYQLASELPMNLDSKQELLEIREESERQSRLIELLDRWLPHLRHLERMRARAGGNGHGLG